MTATVDSFESFRSAGPEERVRIVERVLTGSLRELRSGEPDWFDADTRLADLQIDSIQLVEIKFALDQLVGSELVAGIATAAGGSAAAGGEAEPAA